MAQSGSYVMFRKMKGNSQAPAGQIGKILRKTARRAHQEGTIFQRLLRDALSRAKKADLSAMAGSLAFTTVLALVPLLAVAFYVFKVFGGFDYAYARLLPFLLDMLSEGTGEIVASHISQFIQQVHARAVGFAGIAGLLLTWFLTYQTVVRAFNRVWEVDKVRSVQHRILRALTLLTVGPLLLAASLTVTTAVAAETRFIPFSGQLVAFLLTLILFIMVYALVPMAKIPLGTIIRGSLIPAAMLELAKYGYAIYTHRMVSYSAFYGSFAAVPLFLLWVYIAWYITLFGAVWIRAVQLNRRGR